MPDRYAPGSGAGRGVNGREAHGRTDRTVDEGNRRGATAARIPHPRLVLFRGLPRRPRPRTAPRLPRTPRRRLRRDRHPPRHHHRRRLLRRRRPPRRRPPRHPGQRHDRAPGLRQDLPGGRVLRRRHRRLHRDGRGDGPPAAPGAGALREDRDRSALPGGQGQPPRHPHPRQPRSRHAGPRRRAALRRVRPAQRGRADLLVRHHRRARGGEGLRGHGLRVGVRARRAEEAVPRGHGRGRRRDDGRAGALRRGRGRQRHGWPRRHPPYLPARLHRYRRGLPAARRRPGLGVVAGRAGGAPQPPGRAERTNWRRAFRPSRRGPRHRRPSRGGRTVPGRRREASFRAARAGPYRLRPYTPATFASSLASSSAPAPPAT